MALLITRTPRGIQAINARNYCVNPSFETSINYWSSQGIQSGTNGVIAESRVAGGGKYGTAGNYAWEKKWTTASSGSGGSNSVGWFYQDASWTAGNTRTVSAWIFSNQRVMAFTIQARMKDSSGTVINVAQWSGSMNTVAGDWIRPAATFTAVAGTASVDVYFITAGNNIADNYFRAGDILRIDALQIEAGSTLTPFFDGSFTQDDFYSYAWDGAAHASSSSRYSLDPATRFTPTLVLGWQQGRQSRNTVHVLYSGRVAGVLAAAGLRRGTIEYFFGNLGDPSVARKAAYACEVAHAGSGTWRYIDDDQNNLNDMTYVVDGVVEVVIAESRNTWVCRVPYAEVTP